MIVGELASVNTNELSDRRGAGDREMRNTEWYERLNEDPEFSQFSTATILAESGKRKTINESNENEGSLMESRMRTTQEGEDSSVMETETQSELSLSETPLTTEEERNTELTGITDSEDGWDDKKRRIDTQEMPPPRRSRYSLFVSLIHSRHRHLTPKMLSYQLNAANGGRIHKKKKPTEKQRGELILNLDIFDDTGKPAKEIEKNISARKQLYQDLGLINRKNNSID